MKTGDLVKRKNAEDREIGIVIEVRDDVHVLDEECFKWKYPMIIKVIYLSGNIEFNPGALYELIV